MKHAKTDFELSIMGRSVTLPATQLADGCVGVALIFDTKENAGKYDPNKELIEVVAVAEVKQGIEEICCLPVKPKRIKSSRVRKWRTE